MSGWNTTGDAVAAAPSWDSGSGKAPVWDTGTSSAPTWDDGAAAANDENTKQNGFMTATEEAPISNGEGGGEAKACRLCNEVGHFARECPQKPEGFGKCFNCGQEGHLKADCTNERVFTGTCRICSQEGHQARDCPDKPPVVCRNCKEEGHLTAECTNNKVFDHDNVATLPVEEAWANVVKTAKEAIENRDLDDFRDAMKVYQKACKDVSYDEIERSFRTNGIGIYLIATEPTTGEVLDTHTLVNLSGKRDCKYKLGYFFKKTPRTAKMAEGWPSSEAENLARLKDAGVPLERGVPKCLRCKEMGHATKDCKEERMTIEESVLKCFNCDEEGHRTRDCKATRVDRYACRNCKQSGHNAAECTEPRSAEGVECKRCQEVGHFAKDCPNNPGGGRACRNCGEEGHIAKECEKPKNPATSTCRNCEQVGHFSKDCPEPRDWSKVKCNTCGEMGHTNRRCPQANAANEARPGGFSTDDAGGFDSGPSGPTDANDGTWDDAGAGNGDVGAAADSGWMNAGNGPDTSSTWGTATPTATAGGW